MQLSLGNYLGAKRGLPYPTAGLQVIVYNQTYEDEGTTYYRTSLGIGLPVISGTGLDTVIDFAPLSDARFDKGSYIGNAYGLPEYYNYPYVGIYYDATSEATRYHWKITDFGYAIILAQSLLVDNMFFLKATATTNTSNVIATWDRLFIYSTALADNNLVKIKNYIGIQADFYGDNKVLNSFDWVDSNSDGLADQYSLYTVLTTPVIITGNGFTGNAQKIYKNTTESGRIGIISNYELGIDNLQDVLVSLKYRSSKNFIVYRYSNNIGGSLNIPLNTSDAISYETEVKMQGYKLLLIYIDSPNINDYLEIDEIQIKIIYKNYYAQ